MKNKLQFLKVDYNKEYKILGNLPVNVSDRFSLYSNKESKTYF